MERELFGLLVGVLARIAQSRRRPPKASFIDRDIVLVALWAAFHDRPIDWACRRRNWPWHDRTRPLPSGSTMSRRLRSDSVQRLFLLALTRLRTPVAEGPRTLILDGKPLPVSGHSGDRDAGYGRAARVMARGYKLHAIADMAGNIRAFEVFPLNVSEQAAARVLLARLDTPRGSTLLADGNYDCNNLYDLAANRGVQLIAAKRFKHARGLGHQRHSPQRLESLRRQDAEPGVPEGRRKIEGFFGTMGNVVGGLSPLPNAVRGLERVRRWVAAKIIIDALHRRRRAASNSP